MFGHQNSACLCEPQELFLRRGKLQNAGDVLQKALLMTRVSFAQEMRFGAVELLAMITKWVSKLLSNPDFVL
jgi:hypothetical protein